MMAERLAEIRQACDVMPWGSLPMVRELLDHIAQLEAQRGGSMDLTEDALSLACGCELPPVEGVDAIKFGLRSSLRSGYRNGWRDACAKMQRGGAVVVPPMTNGDCHAILSKHCGGNDMELRRLHEAYRLAVSRIQPIPAAKVLADGMVGVEG